MAEETTGTDMISVLVHDHEEVKEMFGEIESSTDAVKRRELADQVTAELVRHSVAEEMYLYPTAREVLPDGGELADHEIEEHAEAEQLLKRWEGLEGNDPHFMTVFNEMRSGVLEHIEEEEGQLFPALRDALATSQLEELGNKIQQAKKVVPTRPHPSSPDTPPLNKLLAPGAGLVDRVRDKLRGRAN